MIHRIDSRHPAGTIILAAAIQPRYYEFQLSLDRVYAPVGTKLLIERSCDITQNFNKGVKAMIGEWAWFLGDDHSFDENLLLHLLDQNVDVVVPITPCKVAPWLPCMMHGPTDPAQVWHEDMFLYHWSEVSGAGLMALPKGDFIGQAGMLVRKPVLDKLGYPWFKAGQLDPGRLQEDMMFCRDIQQLGYTVWVDQDRIFDHHFIMGVTARKHEGVYVPALKSGTMTIVLPDAKPGLGMNSAYQGTPRVKWVPGGTNDRPIGDQPVLQGAGSHPRRGDEGVAVCDGE